MTSNLRYAACVVLAASLGLAGQTLAAAAAKPAPTSRTAASPAAWTVDKAASRIRFKSAFGGMAFEGGFDRWDARINFDPKNLAASRVVVSVDLGSARTGDADRDQTLPTAEWFNTAKFPRATFSTQAIRDLGGGKYQAVGTLALKGVSRPLVLPFKLAIAGGRARMDGTVVLRRSDFGIGQGQFGGADAVPLEVPVAITVSAIR